MIFFGFTECSPLPLNQKFQVNLNSTYNGDRVLIIFKISIILLNLPGKLVTTFKSNFILEHPNQHFKLCWNIIGQSSLEYITNELLHGSVSVHDFRIVLRPLQWAQFSAPWHTIINISSIDVSLYQARLYNRSSILIKVHSNINTGEHPLLIISSGRNWVAIILILRKDPRL